MTKKAGFNIDLKKIFDSEEKKESDAEKRKRLEAIAKPLDTLIFEECFKVINVLCKAQEVSISHVDGNTMLGGHGQSHNAGYVFQTEITVVPVKEDIPIKYLDFLGYSAARSGDKILAKIPRYDVKEVQSGSTCFGNTYDTFYLNRDWDERENAIEITIINKEHTASRTERAVNFDKFY